MKKFRVKAYYVTTIVIEIEAEDELDAVGKYNQTTKVLFNRGCGEQLAEDIQIEEIK